MNREEAFQAALNGQLNDEQMADLQRDLLADPDSLSEYAEMTWLNGQLHAIGGELPDMMKEPVTLAAERKMPLWISFIMAGIAGALVTLALIPFRGGDFHPVATIVEAEGCRWAGSDLPTAKGSRLSAGRLALEAGMATLEFDSGARIVMEAPATVEVESEMRCRLIEGSLVADVPESAHGFTIGAPDLEVVDLGTRFGLTANQFGKSHVMVFEGEVEVTRAGIGETTNLKTGNSLVNGADLVVPVDEIGLESEPEHRHGWSQVEAFKDTFVRYGEHQRNHGASPLMMVKETNLADNNRRRGIVSFDLSSIGDGVIENAEFFLDVESSGLGFSTLVPDSKFAVYAVTDDSLDNWEENKVLWDTLPAMNNDGVLQESTERLGTFEILRGASAAVSVKISSPELTRLLREDANRIVTFLVVRETGEYESQGLVHAFATREHPTAKGPTLYFTLR